MVDLPPEIWYHVISFIPPRVVRRFFALNRTFFNEVMREKYWAVVIDSKDYKLYQVLETIRNPAVSHLVESVHIIPDLSDRSYFNGAKDDAEKSLPTVPCVDTSQSGSILSNVKTACGQHLKWSLAPLYYDPRLLQASTPADILEAIRGLHRLESVHVEWNFFEVFPTAYATSLWSAIASHQIKTVTLTATTTGLDTLIPSSSVTLTKLTSIFLTIKHKSNAMKEDTELRDKQLAAASFLNSLQGSLQALHAKSVPFHGLELLWANLGHFTCLKTVDLDITTPAGVSLTEPDQLYALPCYLFLTRHKTQIESIFCKTLRAGYLNPDQKLATDFKFDKLKSLSLDTNILTGRRKRVTEFLNHHKHGLKSFEVLGEISPTELDETLHIFTYRPRGPILTSLSISVYKLDLSLLQKLARFLPALETLKLYVSTVASQNSMSIVPGQYYPLLLPPHDNVHGFVSDILAWQEGEHWNLRHITVRRVSCCLELTLWNLMRVLAVKIPTVVCFAGKRYLEIPDREDLEGMKKVGLRCPRGVRECLHGKDGLDASPY